MPSATLSRYIMGTIGESAQSRKPTSALLYTRIPISFPAIKKRAAKIKEMSEVIRKTVSVVYLIMPSRFFARDSDISGISRVVRELSRVEGKKRTGNAIPFIIPN